MSLVDFIKKVQEEKSEDINRLEELQRIFDQTRTDKEEVYMVSFSATE
jgi:hypothetical protein